MVLGMQCLFAMYSVAHFQCGIFKSCDENGVCTGNGLVCFLHYIKFSQSIYLMNKYYRNIKQREVNHPIGQLNVFIVITIYFLCLVYFIGDFKQEKAMVQLCAVYPAADFFMIMLSYCMISRVLTKKQWLINDRRYAEHR